MNCRHNTRANAAEATLPLAFFRQVDVAKRSDFVGSKPSHQKPPFTRHMGGSFGMVQGEIWKVGMVVHILALDAQYE